MSEYVTKEDLREPECGCGHKAHFHLAFGTLNGCVGRPGEVVCPCPESAEDVRAPHLDGIVRREVAKALREVPGAWLAYTSCDDGDGGDDFDHWVKSYAAAIESEGQS